MERLKQIEEQTKKAQQGNRKFSVFPLMMISLSKKGSNSKAMSISE